MEIAFSIVLHFSVCVGIFTEIKLESLRPGLAMLPPFYEGEFQDFKTLPLLTSQMYKGENKVNHTFLK